MAAARNLVTLPKMGILALVLIAAVLVAMVLVNPGRASATTCTDGPGGGDLVSNWQAEGDGCDSADGNHGTLEGGTTFAPGPIGQQAFSFDGLDDYVDAGNSANLDFGTSNFTISAWVNTNNGTKTNLTAIVSKWSLPDSEGYYLQYAPSSKTWYFGWAPNSFLSTAHNISDGNWHFVAGVRTGLASAELYVDGQLIGSTATLSGSSDSDAPWNIGRLTDSTVTGLARHFDGLVDDVRIYNRALTGGEVAALMDCVDGPGGGDLVGYWRAEGNACDSAGANHGTLKNGISFDTGLQGQAFKLDDFNDFVEIPHNLR